VTGGFDPDSVFVEIRNAARLTGGLPLRRGNQVILPAAGEVMVTGDLHGDAASFDRIVRIADLASSPSRHLVLQELVHGHDDENGAAGSCVLIERAARLINRFPGRVHVILGNHEASELTGRVIVKEGVVLNRLVEIAAARRYGERHEEALAFFHGFWRSLPLAVRMPNRVLVSHSTPSRRFLDGFSAEVLARPLEPRDFDRGGSAYALLWGRDFEPETAERVRRILDADVFVVGHTPCEEGFAAPNGVHVILDSQGAPGKYVILPLERPLTCEDILGRIGSVWG